MFRIIDIAPLATDAYRGRLVGKQYGLLFLVGYVCFLLLALLHLGIGADMLRNGTTYAVRMLWAVFGLVAGSGLAVTALALGIGAWRFCIKIVKARRRLIRSLVILHGLIVVYASGLLLIWLTILSFQL